MDRIATGNGKVSHIPASITDGPDGRTVTTMCGKAFDEASLAVDNESKECAACNKKFKAAVEDATDIVLPEE